MDNKDLSRLIFLAEQYRLRIPRIIEKNIPSGDLIAQIGLKGLRATAVEYGLDPKQLVQLHDKGETEGKPSLDEFLAITSSLAMDSLEEQRDLLKQSDYLRTYRAICDFGLMTSSSLIQNDEASFADTSDRWKDIEKFSSGFAPIDLVTGGLYQGVVTIIGATGSGKTSVMLALAAAMRQSGVIDELWFYETEIPLSMMMYKTKHLRARVPFGEKDRMICGMPSLSDIELEVNENPNPNRAVFIDSPDVIVGAEGDGKRHALESVYQTLLKIKNKSKIVVVSSQAKRGETIIGIESPSESSSKAQYSDLLLGVHRQPSTARSDSNMMINVPKNRFGEPDHSVTFPFNYERLEGELTDESLQEYQDDSEW